MIVKVQTKALYLAFLEPLANINLLVLQAIKYFWKASTELVMTMPTESMPYLQTAAAHSQVTKQDLPQKVTCGAQQKEATP